MILNVTIVPYLIFLTSLIGVILNRKNILLILVSIELCLLSINYGFLTSSVLLDDLLGQILAIFILTVAAGETSIGLAILVLYFRIHGSIAIDYINLLKG
jgi:NADH-quinone oxidoreductase subunit K